jgi:FkbM family methyltransferase
MSVALATSTEADFNHLARMDLNFGNGIVPFFYRRDSLGDQLAVKQVFQDMCYRIDQWPQGMALLRYYVETSRTQRPLIIDAGANIGAATTFFLNIFRDAFVFAIEPEDQNVQLLILNTVNYKHIFNFPGAIASRDGTLCVTDPGKTDMGFRTWELPADATGPRARQKVKALSPASVVAHPIVAGGRPLIFKIDIEGAEAELFGGDTDWMRQFPLIIIELHDWMLPFSGSSRNFLTALAKYDFDVLYRGENIFLFNREILAAYASS